jgi:hypothetical protein
MATGMTFTPASASRLVTFTATSGSVDIYTNGQTLGAISFTPASGGATFNIRDTLTTLAASNTFVHITAGSVVSNGNTLNIGGLGFNGAATRSLDISGSTVNITGTGGTAFTSSGTNQTLTMDANTVINFTYVGATDSTMNSAAGQTFPTINVSTNSGGAIHNFLTASATNVNIAAGRSIGMNSTAKTWTNLTALGTNANPIYFTGTSGTPTQLNVTNSNVNYVIVQNVANNGNTIYDYGGSTTDGSNTGWLYPAFPGGGTALLMGV